MGSGGEGGGGGEKLPESGWGPGSPGSRVLAFLERLSHGAIPWEQFNWLKKPASCPKTPLYPPPTRVVLLSRSFRRALVILSRLTPRVEDRRPRIECPPPLPTPLPPRKAWPLSWSIPLGASNCTARRGWLYRTEWRFPFAESGPGLLVLLACARDEKTQWICCTWEMRRAFWGRRAVKSRARGFDLQADKQERRVQAEQVAELFRSSASLLPNQIAWLASGTFCLTLLRSCLWEWARVWNSWENSNRKRARARARHTVFSVVAVCRESTKCAFGFYVCFGRICKTRFWNL